MYVLVHSTCSECFANIVSVGLFGSRWWFGGGGRGPCSFYDGVADSSCVVRETVGLTHSLAAAGSFCHCG